MFELLDVLPEQGPALGAEQEGCEDDSTVDFHLCFQGYTMFAPKPVLESTEGCTTLDYSCRDVVVHCDCVQVHRKTDGQTRSLQILRSPIEQGVIMWSRYIGRTALRLLVRKRRLLTSNNKAVIARRLRPVVATLEGILSARKAVLCVRWSATGIAVHSL